MTNFQLTSIALTFRRELETSSLDPSDFVRVLRPYGKSERINGLKVEIDLFHIFARLFYLVMKSMKATTFSLTYFCRMEEVYGVRFNKTLY